MKRKSISKIIAMLLMVAVTICMTSCETEEKFVPPTSGPRSKVKLEDSHVEDGYLCVHLLIANLNDEMTARDLVYVKVRGNDDAEYGRINYSRGDYNVHHIEDAILEPNMQYHLVYMFYTLWTKSDTATLTVTDKYSGEVIGEWEVDVDGIMDMPWDK